MEIGEDKLPFSVGNNIQFSRIVDIGYGADVLATPVKFIADRQEMAIPDKPVDYLEAIFCEMVLIRAAVVGIERRLNREPWWKRLMRRISNVTAS